MKFYDVYFMLLAGWIHLPKSNNVKSFKLQELHLLS